MPTALIHDEDFSSGSHGDTVRSVFEETAPAGWSVIEYESFLADGGGAVDEAIAQGAIMVIRSAANTWLQKSDQRRAWENGILFVNSHGSNLNNSLEDPPYLYETVVVGAEETSDEDTETSFGPGLELDAVPDPALGLSVAQSWAAPAAAALLAAAWDALPSAPAQERWFNARAWLRDLAGEPWTEERGFGVVEQTASVPGSIDPEELSVQPPVSATFTEPEDGRLDITWVNYTQSRYAETIIEDENGTTLYRGTDASLTLYTDADPHELRFRTLAQNNELSTYASATRDVSAVGWDQALSVTRVNSQQFDVSTAAVEGSSTWGVDVADSFGPFVEEASGGTTQRVIVPSEARPHRLRMRPKGQINGFDTLGEPSTEIVYAASEMETPPYA